MSRKRSRRKGAPSATSSTPVVEPAVSAWQRLTSDRRGRRRALQWLGGLGLASIGAVAIARHDARSRELHDLAVIGDGAPVVVQVHDPSCALCRRLMSTARATLDDMPSIRYRVADLTSMQGRAFADRHDAGKVTLLLFDGRGRLVERIEGVTPAESLRRTFEQRLAGPA